MIKKETNISQINSYLKGELDSKAMHLLEKKALEDPFLMDALEGYENNNNSQQAHLDELKNRLQQRILKPDRKIAFLKFIAIAASVLIVISIGGTWFYLTHYINKQQLTQNIGQVSKSSPSTSEPIIQYNKSEIAKLNAVSKLKPIFHFSHSKKEINDNTSVEAITPSPVTDQKLAEASMSDKIFKNNVDSSNNDTTPLNEMIVMGYTTRKKNNVAEAPTGNIETPKKSDTISQQLLQGQAKGVTANNVNAPKPDPSIILPLVAPGISQLKEVSIIHKDYSSLKKIVKGRVVGNDDGLPIPGVTVKVTGTNTETQTDANGYFKLPAINGSENLVVGFIGYQTVEVKTHSGDSLKTISLKPASNALSEVVVTNYTSQSKSPDTSYTTARPKDGWAGFRKYLKKNAISPDGKTGTVKLSFEINHDGVISKLQIVNGLTDITNQKAIDLIKNGPTWLGNTNGAPETVKVKIKFN